VLIDLIARHQVQHRITLCDKVAALLLIEVLPCQRVAAPTVSPRNEPGQSDRSCRA
jgi:hypothetical protein